MSEPKRCPYCGGEAECTQAHQNGLWRVRCTRCHARGPGIVHRESAIEAWDRVSAAMPVPAFVVEMKK